MCMCAQRVFPLYICEVDPTAKLVTCPVAAAQGKNTKACLPSACY